MAEVGRGCVHTIRTAWLGTHVIHHNTMENKALHCTERRGGTYNGSLISAQVKSETCVCRQHTTFQAA